MPELKSILLLDDEQDALDLTTSLLETRLKVHVVPTKFPTHAIQLAQAHCFDLILLDATLSYHGSQFGGLEVYKTLQDRYGASSMVVYSQYINDELLQRYHLSFNFVEKHHATSQWMPRLEQALISLRSQQTCFVAMPFGSAYDALYEMIRDCIISAGYICVRIDQRIFTDSIEQRIFQEVRAAKIVLFVATGNNANVFYEAGYAMALGKEIVTITEDFAALPFDIRNRKAISYGNDPQVLAAPLASLLSQMTDARSIIKPI